MSTSARVISVEKMMTNLANSAKNVSFAFTEKITKVERTNSKKMIEKECCFKVREWDRKELEKKHTKQLLDLRDGGFNSVYWNSGSGWCGEYSDCGKECLDVVKHNRNLVLDILSHREHIPSKIESKLLRKARKKAGVKRDGRKTQRFNQRSNRQRHS